jgi:hypothetical protein
VTSAKIVDATIVTADLADNSVTSAKIVDATIVTADLADNSVTSAKIVDATIATADLADGSVTLPKINSTGAVANQSIMFDGVSVIWGAPAASSLVMPFSQTADEATRMFTLQNTNAVGGEVARFFTSNAANSGDVLEVENAGLGRTIYATSTNVANPMPALHVVTSSANVGGSAAEFSGPAGGTANIVESFSQGSGAAIYGSSTGTGAGVQAINSGSGAAVLATSNTGAGVSATSNGSNAGSFTITNAANASTALVVSTLGAGMGVSAISTSNTAISGASTSGTGVAAASTTGAGLSASSTNGNAVNATSTNGVGVSASSTNGPGLTAATGSATQYAATFTGTAIGSHGIQINAGAGGMAINVVRGGLIASYTTVASGGAIPSDYIVVEVQDDLTAAVPATATLPLVATNGQIIITSTNDPDGLVVNGVGQGTFDTRRWTYTGGIWKSEF